MVAVLPSKHILKSVLFFIGRRNDMATTRGWAMKGNIVNLVNYILDIGNGEEKTDDGLYVSCNSGVSPMAEAFKLLMKLNLLDIIFNYRCQQEKVLRKTA